MPTSGRRTILQALTAAVATLAAGRIADPAMTSAAAAMTESRPVQTLLAFADTLIPGQHRFPGDVVVADAVTGPGAVQAGAIDILTSPHLALEPLLPSIASLLDARAVAYATARLIWLTPFRPPFVGLAFSHRTALVESLFNPGDVDRPVWQVLSLLMGLAFDTAGQYDTQQAVTQTHPGLAWLGFPEPDADGLWRFVDFSYGRPLAALHPATSPSGSPA
ncbi:DUF5987 family protein [Streptomyces sp. NBC_00289]|uniref:DUF5987 family protein n=1 Tax=Streptomyces sp. NBC_00289 TaxID=2975703 RepID=UPI00324F3A48